MDDWQAVVTPDGGASNLTALGRHYGYPECCIKEYVSDIAQGRHPIGLRNCALAPSGDGTYVMCSECAADEDQQSVEDILAVVEGISAPAALDRIAKAIVERREELTRAGRS